MSLLKDNKIENLSLSYKIEREKLSLGWNPFRKVELDYKVFSALMSRRKSVHFRYNNDRMRLKEKNRYQTGSARDYFLTAA